MHGGTHSHILTHTNYLGLRPRPSMSALSPRSGIQVSSVYPTYTHIKGQSPVCVWGGGVCVRACVHACMHVCVCECVCVYACMWVCVAKPVAVELRCHASALIFFLLWIHLYLNNRFFLGLTFSL